MIKVISVCKKFYNNCSKLASELSEEEKNQLGNLKPGSKFKYVDKEKWQTFREYLVDKSNKSNPKLDRDLTAYTPGETVNLLNHPKIKGWMMKMDSYKIPENYKLIILVPCAKTKPWGLTRPKKSDLYNAYHKILEMFKDKQLQIKGDVYFVTISEPLGVVPQEFWDSFPQYDNPGLFKDPVMRSGGIFTSQYKETPLGEKQIIPFDENAYNKAINLLSSKIENFMLNNKMPGRVFVSFVEDNSGKIKTTHSDMLDRANIKEILLEENRFPKPPGKTSLKEKEDLTDYYFNKLKNIKL